MKKIRRHLKKHFVPHRGNGHRPHMLRKEKIRTIASFVVLIELMLAAYLFGLAPKIFNGADVVGSVLTDLTNQERAAAGAGAVKNDPALARAAQMKADDMVARGYFAHKDPDGKDPWQWFDKAGYDYSYAGENLAINYYDTREAQDAWMNSAAHRANILNKDFTEMGIGQAQGMMDGKPVFFVVEFFGAKAGSPVETIATAVAVPKTPPQAQTVAAVAAAKPKPVPVEEKNIEVEPFAESNLATVQASASYASEDILVSPERVVNMGLIAAVVALVAAMTFMYSYRKHHLHPDLMINGFAMSMTLVMFIGVNYYVFTGRGEIAQPSSSYMETSRNS